MEKKSDFKSGIPWLLTGAAITILVVILLKSTTISHAQSSKASSEVGTYQITSFSFSDGYRGFFIMDTRNGKIVGYDVGAESKMQEKYGK